MFREMLRSPWAGETPKTERAAEAAREDRSGDARQLFIWEATEPWRLAMKVLAVSTATAASRQ